MKTKKPYEKYDPLLSELMKGHDIIAHTYNMQKELQIPVDITNKIGFALRTLKSTLKEIEKVKNTEKFLWEDSLAQFSIV